MKRDISRADILALAPASSGFGSAEPPARKGLGLTQLLRLTPQPAAALLPQNQMRETMPRSSVAISFTLLAGIVLLCGCATQAQREFQTMKTGNAANFAKARACHQAVYDSPEYAPVRPHNPSQAGEASIQQLSDTSLASNAEIQAILAAHPKANECRRAVLAATAQTEPTLVPVLTAYYNKNEDDLIALTQRKIAWGEYLRRNRSRATEAQAALLAEDHQVVSDLRQEHQAEVAQRQRAAEAFAAWAQTEQLINAANRPVITNCNRFGNMTNCVSQ